MSGPQFFYLPAGVTPQQLITALSQQFTVSHPTVATQVIDFYDTFDWRLYDKSLVLYYSSGFVAVRRLYNHQTIHQLALDAVPKFVWDFPDGPLKKQLEPVVAMRALLPQVRAEVQSKSFRILNQNQKTVVKLAFEVLHPTGEGVVIVPPLVRLNPVRGYDSQAKTLAEALDRYGLTLAPTQDAMLVALKTANKTPGDYSARLDFQLDPDMRSDEATRVILRHLLNVITRNEAGVKQDIDTEFLHDFRVAIRRTRSALSQIRGVFPTEITERFKQDFADIARVTNELRDLDVYLLSEDHYRRMLPALFRDDIAPLFDFLRYKRSAALQAVISVLNSERYKQVLREWQMFLNEPPGVVSGAPNAERPIIDLARHRINKRYRRVVKSGKKILENTEDEQLHALRIACKKLRYLMEFFASLFPPDEISALIKQLKKLQDNLGDFNDVCVQEEYLLRVADELPVEEPGYRHTLLALGSLVGTLHLKRTQIKSEFAQTFTNFASPDNKKQFKALFSRRKDGAP